MVLTTFRVAFSGGRGLDDVWCVVCGLCDECHQVPVLSFLSSEDCESECLEIEKPWAGQWRIEDEVDSVKLVPRVWLDWTSPGSARRCIFPPIFSLLQYFPSIFFLRCISVVCFCGRGEVICGMCSVSW